MSKKKFRDITVDGVDYAWLYKNGNMCSGQGRFVIWKDKKIIFEDTWCTCCHNMSNVGIEDEDRNVTPKLVADFIRNIVSNED